MPTNESRLTSLRNDNKTLSKENVKLPTKHSMPNIQNNTSLKQQQLDIILNSNLELIKQSW